MDQIFCSVVVRHDLYMHCTPSDMRQLQNFLSARRRRAILDDVEAWDRKAHGETSRTPTVPEYAPRFRHGHLEHMTGVRCGLCMSEPRHIERIDADLLELVGNSRREVPMANHNSKHRLLSHWV